MTTFYRDFNDGSICFLSRVFDYLRSFRPCNLHLPSALVRPTRGPLVPHHLHPSLSSGFHLAGAQHELGVHAFVVVAVAGTVVAVVGIELGFGESSLSERQTAVRVAP